MRASNLIVSIMKKIFIKKNLKNKFLIKLTLILGVKMLFGFFKMLTFMRILKTTYILKRHQLEINKRIKF